MGNRRVPKVYSLRKRLRHERKIRRALLARLIEQTKPIPAVISEPKPRGLWERFKDWFFGRETFEHAS